MRFILEQGARKGQFRLGIEFGGTKTNKARFSRAFRNRTVWKPDLPCFFPPVELPASVPSSATSPTLASFPTPSYVTSVNLDLPYPMGYLPELEGSPAPIYELEGDSLFESGVLECLALVQTTQTSLPVLSPTQTSSTISPVSFAGDLCSPKHASDNSTVIDPRARGSGAGTGWQPFRREKHCKRSEDYSCRCCGKSFIRNDAKRKHEWKKHRLIDSRPVKARTTRPPKGNLWSDHLNKVNNNGSSRVQTNKEHQQLQQMASLLSREEPFLSTDTSTTFPIGDPTSWQEWWPMCQVPTTMTLSAINQRPCFSSMVSPIQPTFEFMQPASRGYVRGTKVSLPVLDVAMPSAAKEFEIHSASLPDRGFVNQNGPNSDKSNNLLDRAEDSYKCDISAALTVPGSLRSHMASTERTITLSLTCIEPQQQADVSIDSISSPNLKKAIGKEHDGSDLDTKSSPTSDGKYHFQLEMVNRCASGPLMRPSVSNGKGIVSADVTRSVSAPYHHQALTSVTSPRLEAHVTNQVSLFYASRPGAKHIEPGASCFHNIALKGLQHSYSTSTGCDPCVHTTIRRSQSCLQQNSLHRYPSRFKIIPFANIMRSASQETPEFLKSVAMFNGIRYRRYLSEKIKFRARGGRLSKSKRRRMTHLAYPPLACDICSKVFSGQFRRRNLAGHRRHVHEHRARTIDRSRSRKSNCQTDNLARAYSFTSSEVGTIKHESSSRSNGWEHSKANTRLSRAGKQCIGSSKQYHAQMKNKRQPSVRFRARL